MNAGVFGRGVATIVWLAFALIGMAVPASAESVDTGRAGLRVTTVSLAELGYGSDITLHGVYPSFTFNVPVYPTLTAAKLSLHVHVASLVDPQHSSLQVFVDGVPVYAHYISQSGYDAVLEIPLPLPPRSRTSMQVEGKAYLTITGDICFDLQSIGLFMTVSSASTIELTTKPSSGASTIADFFSNYGDRITIVDARPRSATRSGLDIIALPYQLRHLERWHRLKIGLASHPDPQTRNIVVQPGTTHYDAERDTLYVDPGDLQIMTSNFVPLLVTDGLHGAAPVAEPTPQVAVSPSPFPAPPRDLRLNFAALGIVSQTASGLGDITFRIPLDAERFGGLPDGLVLHVAYAQTPLLASTSGIVRVELNGTLLASRTLDASGRRDVWDVPIPASAIATTNDLSITASFFTGPGSCRGNLPALTMTIFDTSYFSWNGADRNVGSIADFLKIVSGKVDVLVGDDAMVPQAFHLVSEIGRINSDISEVHVDRFSGTFPQGYDYFIIVSPPRRLAALRAPLRLDEAQFRIVNPLTGATLFGTTFTSPVGALELADAGSTPALVLSYWSNPEPLRRFDRFDIDDLSQQIGDITLFDGVMRTYQVGEKLRVYYASGDPLEHLWELARLPLAVVLGVITIAIMIFAARRLTGGPSR